MRTVVVTGGSRGIGAEIVRAFAKNGDNVVINYNKSKDKAEQLAKEVMQEYNVQVMAVKADVSKPDQVEFLINTAIQVFGKIDVLVNNAGISLYNILIDSTVEQIQEIINTNLNSCIYASKYAAQNMMSNQSGKIINISSMWGIVGGSGESVYSASKAGLIGFSKALAKELGYSGITVNVVAPGAIETDMISNLSLEDKQAIADQTAVGRLGKPSDIASVVVFLASSSADYITGQVISVDGGYVI